MISVLDFSLCSLPQCISRPSEAKVSLMMFVPLVASSLVLNGKAPSSRYSICVISCDSPFLKFARLCPVSCPFGRFAVGVCSVWTFGRFAADHFLSSVSANAVMMNRKMTGERLSPWRTPTVWFILAISFPIFSVTLSSV